MRMDHPFLPMKMTRIFLIAVGVILSPFSHDTLAEGPAAKGWQAPDNRMTSDAHPGNSATADGRRENLKAPSDYGPVDSDGFPTNPEFAMNSDKIDDEQRQQLRQNPPVGYQVGAHFSPRYVMGACGDIEWRHVSKGKVLSTSKESMAGMLGLNPTDLPPSLNGDEMVLKSPSGRRVIVQSAGYADRVFLFEAEGGTIDLSSSERLHCINFDDRRRAFIRWEAFVGESLIVGRLADDGDLEKFPSREILYAYDIDKRILRRVVFPKEVIDRHGENFMIDSAGQSALLLRWDRAEVPTTVFLNGL